MASYPRSERVVVQPRAVRPSPVGYFTTYLPAHPTPFPYYVVDGGAVLYPVNSGYFSSVIPGSSRSREFFHTRSGKTESTKYSNPIK